MQTFSSETLTTTDWQNPCPTSPATVSYCESHLVVENPSLHVLQIAARHWSELDAPSTPEHGGGCSPLAARHTTLLSDCHTVFLHAVPDNLACGLVSNVPNLFPKIVMLVPIDGDILGSTVTGRGGLYATDLSRGA